MTAVVTAQVQCEGQRINTIIIDLVRKFPHHIPTPTMTEEQLAGTYVPVEGRHDIWPGQEREDYVPTERQTFIIAAVTYALLEGLFYSSEILARVKQLLDVSPEVAALGKGVEGGNLGMDCYYARKFIESQATIRAEREAARRMNLVVGSKIGAVTLTDGKRNTGAIVIEVLNDYTFKLEAKRGAQKVHITRSALNLRYAIDRAHERGYRKDNCESIWPAI